MRRAQSISTALSTGMTCPTDPSGVDTRARRAGPTPRYLMVRIEDQKTASSAAAGHFAWDAGGFLVQATRLWPNEGQYNRPGRPSRCRRGDRYPLRPMRRVGEAARRVAAMGRMPLLKPNKSRLEPRRWHADNDDHRPLGGGPRRPWYLLHEGRTAASGVQTLRKTFATQVVAPVCVMPLPELHEGGMVAHTRRRNDDHHSKRDNGLRQSAYEMVSTPNSS